MKIIAQFEIPYYQILNESSQIVADLPDFAKNIEHLQQLYRLMFLNRVFDTKAVALQRTGKLGTYPSTRGQEAGFVGIGDAMDKNDIFVPYYRDVACLYMRGVSLTEILLYWGGDERGNGFIHDNKDFSYSVPIGTQVLHAAGVATAFKLRNEKRAVLTTCGDGGTSEGDFYEAINIAGIWKLPIVFIVCNNQWAISMPRNTQTAAQTLAQKAIAGGIAGEQVDGNDIIAIRDRIFLALKKAREIGEPTLIEILNYRHSDHTTADDATRYEPKNLRETEWVKEPILRLRHYLESLNAWSPQQEEQLQAECTSKIDQVVEAYLNTPAAAPETIIDYLYQTLPKAYFKQREALKNLKEKNHA